ncbi:MAG: T9SS type A sorting domain-containing protein [Bacteroidetes bacterium]|nr:T9SS type A sorting domain-containing protein [Bacteroidota bacterium]
MPRHWILICWMLIPGFLVTAQVEWGGDPVSRAHPLPLLRQGVILDTPLLEQVQQEDQQYPTPYRFGISIPAPIDLIQAGQWDESDGKMVCRYRVVAPGAKAISLCFDDFHLPQGGTLFIYTPDYSSVAGAYSFNNNHSSGVFSTRLFPGEEVVVEYVQGRVQGQVQVRGEGGGVRLGLSEVVYAYRGVEFLTDQKGSGACEVNINCPEGVNWQEEKRGVVKIHIKKGFNNLWCSGSLVNNTAQDRKPYVLTADHCGSTASASDLLQWVFYFNYESTQCQTNTGIPFQTMNGAKKVAQGGNSGWDGSDFYLVLLNGGIPDLYQPYYIGWDRRDTAIQNGVGIHHPSGDVKKISTYTTPLVSSQWLGGGQWSHWQVIWSATQSGHGVTEGGSSGSPIFNPQGQIVGTLTGGEAGCDTASLNLPDYYGKFSWSWESNGTDSTAQLKPWLDPVNSGVWRIDGLITGLPMEMSQSAELKVFPNPFHDKFEIDLSQLPQAEWVEIDLYNPYGMSVYHERITKNPASIYVNVTSGFYLLKLRTPADLFSTKLICH